jgi:hypothetical protein
MMMHLSGGLYKAPAEMLYSGALSVAPHNCVDADATAVAPQEGHQTRGRFFGPSLKNQRAASLSVGHDGEPLVEADIPRSVLLVDSLRPHARECRLTRTR